MTVISKLSVWWATTPTTEIVWLALGFTAQLMFSMRFILQWIASERARRSIVPEVFWYFSFVGGAMLLAYAIYRVDPVFIMGQAMEKLEKSTDALKAYKRLQEKVPFAQCWDPKGWFRRRLRPTISIRPHGHRWKPVP